jgi:hypothetical protein
MLILSSRWSAEEHRINEKRRPVIAATCRLCLPLTGVGLYG